METATIRKQLFRQLVKAFFGRGVISKISFILIFVFVFAAIFAPVLTPYNPTEQSLEEALAGPSADHLLGADNLGRDLLTRILYGARISLITSLLSSVWAAALGTLLGTLAGYYGRILGQSIMRLTDAHLSIPPLILAMVLASLFGGGVLGVSIAIGIAVIPTYIRVSNSVVLSIKENDFITEAALIGLRKWKIVFKHLLPNCIPSLLVIFTMNLGVAIMIEAALSYLGVGISPPTPAWGSMVSEGYNYLITNPSLALLPGFCVMLIVVAFNIVGDGLRDALDPRLRGKL
jgi:peptide/nickel transport system permease protein